MGDFTKVNPTSSPPAVTGGFFGNKAGCDPWEGSWTKWGAETGDDVTIGWPPTPRLILILKPSSSNSNSVRSERFIRSMTCLICFKSK